jgi:hypothetical protein
MYGFFVYDGINVSLENVTTFVLGVVFYSLTREMFMAMLAEYLRMIYDL